MGRAGKKKSRKEKQRSDEMTAKKAVACASIATDFISHRGRK